VKSLAFKNGSVREKFKKMKRHRKELRNDGC